MPKKSPTSKKKQTKKALPKNTQTKKTLVKKPVKKTISSKAAKKKKAAKDSALLVEFIELCRELNDDGLKFLIKQAKVLQHNLKVEKKLASLKVEKKNIKDVPESTPRVDVDVDIHEGEDHRFFNIIIENYRNFFELSEFKTIVKLCHISKDEKDASERLYSWISKQRSDVIRNSSIIGATDPVLAKVYNLIITRYTVKE